MQEFLWSQVSLDRIPLEMREGQPSLSGKKPPPQHDIPITKEKKNQPVGLWMMAEKKRTQLRGYLSEVHK